MTSLTLATALLLAADPPRPAGLADNLKMPAHVRVDGKPIDVERSGHAAPFVGDFDGDGTPDLLVGQFHDGALRVYPGRGGSGERVFGEFTWFRAGSKDGRIPSG
ncbi:MAG TPA: hypothetical protein VKD90_03910 [Gemmataceae bacterium]|nr:hypothetical protein [Gemmataceae bacterium]